MSITNLTILQILPDSEDAAPRATDEQIRKASALIKRIDLKDFSVCQFANPGMLLFTKLKIIFLLQVMCSPVLFNNSQPYCSLIDNLKFSPLPKTLFLVAVHKIQNNFIICRQLIHTYFIMHV